MLPRAANSQGWVIVGVLTLLGGCAGAVEGPDPAGSGTQTAPKEAASQPVAIVDGDPGLPVPTRDGSLDGTPLGRGSRSRRGRYGAVVTEALALYPPAFLAAIGLKQVVLCETLSFEKTPCHAYAVVERGQLFVSLKDDPDPAYIRRTVHHELFHQVDFADDGRLDTDARWERLNPPGFHYTGDVEQQQSDPDATRVDETLTGFLNRYAMTSPAEDKAELFAALVLDGEAPRRRATGDPVLRRKVERVHEMLQHFGAPGRQVLAP